MPCDDPNDSSGEGRKCFKCNEKDKDKQRDDEEEPEEEFVDNEKQPEEGLDSDLNKNEALSDVEEEPNGRDLPRSIIYIILYVPYIIHHT